MAIYELREYTSLPLLHRKQAELVGKKPLFEKAGIEFIGAWNNVVGRNQLTRYILKYDSLGDREVKWAKFVADPEVWALIKEYGPVSMFEDNAIMQPLEYSPLQ